jgi:DUF3102 family protein
VENMSFSTLATAVVPSNRALAVVEEAPNQVLDRLAAELRNHSRSSTVSILLIGKLLVQAKQHLGHGEFVQWVDRACGFTIRSAQNCMRASELAAREGEIISLLNPAALYRLARRKTPPEAVTLVVEMLKRGFVPTEAEVIVLILAYSYKDQEPSAPVDGVDDQGARHLARELHSRLGPELVSRLIGSRWSNLRKRLREQIECCAAEPQDHQACTEAPSGELQVG